jgi:DNA-binding NarL/FixJ family response regulator
MAAVIAGVALLQDRPAQAAEALDRAADQVGRYSFNSSLRARWGAAEARRRSGAQDAVALLLAVEAQAQDAGMAPLLARIHRSLRLAGVSRSAPRAQDRSGLVTVRERQVLDLVAAGWSNADIARRLGVGRPTVRRLIENARGKLDAPDRVAAAARLAGHG